MNMQGSDSWMFYGTIISSDWNIWSVSQYTSVRFWYMGAIWKAHGL